MPRGKRKSIDDKIEEKMELINALQIRLDSEKRELKEMNREKRDQEMERISSFLEDSGLSMKDAENILKEHIAPGAAAVGE